MRIVMLLQNETYPEDTRVRYEAISLVAAGHEVAVIAPAEDGEVRHEVVDRVEVFRFKAPTERHGFFGYLLEHVYSTLAILAVSLRVFRKRRFDVVHAHCPPDLLAFVAAPFKLLGRRYVYDHHDLAPDLYRARFGQHARPAVERALLLFERVSCRLADHVLATNESYRQVEIERGHVRPDRITVVRNGPDAALLEPVEPLPDLAAEPRPVLVYVGAMGPQDGLDHLVRALDHLVHGLGRSEVLCVLVGDGTARPEAERLVEELALQENVRFIGRIPNRDVASYIAAADIGVEPAPSTPYTERSTMVKVLEYMSQSKPVVAFDLVENRYSGAGAAVFVPPNDEKLFAEEISSLIDDPARREELGRTGRRRVEEELSWEYSERKLVAAYASLSRR